MFNVSYALKKELRDNISAKGPDNFNILGMIFLYLKQKKTVRLGKY